MPLWTPAALVPGLYLAALVALGTLGLRRTGERHPGWFAAATLVAVAALYGPALAGGRVLVAVEALDGVPPFGEIETAGLTADATATAQVLSTLPAEAAARRALAAGEWPLWDPYAGAGSPLTGGAARPFALLPSAALPLPLAEAAGVTAALRTLVAIVFTFLWLSRLGAGAPAAATGAFSYGLGGYLQRWLLAPPAEVAALLPVLLWAVARADERRGRGELALVATSVAVLLAAGGEAAGYALVAGLAYLLVRLARRPADGRARALAAPLLAAAVGIACAAPAWLPAARLASVSAETAALAERAKGSRQGDALGLATLGDSGRRREALAATSGRLVQAVAPLAFGDPRRGAYWGPGDAEQLAAAFPGTPALALALIGAWGWAIARWKKPGEPTRLADENFLIGSAAVSGLFVARPPGFASLTDHLPLVGPSPNFHEGVAMIFALAVAGLAAAGLGHLAAMPRNRRRRTAGAVALGLFVFLLWATFDHPPPDGTPAPLTRSRRVALAVQGMALAAVAAVPAGGAVSFVVGSELVALHAGVNPGRRRSSVYPRAPVVAAIQDRAASRPGARMAALGGMFPPQLGSVYAVGDVRLAGPHRSVAWEHLVAPIERFRDGRQVPRLRPGDHPLFDLLSVRWLLTVPEETPEGPWHKTFAGETATLWERDGALPPLFLPAATEVFVGGDWAKRLRANADFRARALVPPDATHGEAWRAASTGDDTVAVEAFGLSAIRARAVLSEQRLLATSIYQDGGWRALADGRPLATGVANGPLLAAWLPPEAGRIDLIYRPRTFLGALALAALGLAAAGVWLAAPRIGRGVAP